MLGVIAGWLTMTLDGISDMDGLERAIPLATATTVAIRLEVVAISVTVPFRWQVHVREAFPSMSKLSQQRRR